MAQVAIAWTLAQGEDIVPIPGTKRRSYLEENMPHRNSPDSGGDGGFKRRLEPGDCGRPLSSRTDKRVGI